MLFRSIVDQNGSPASGYRIEALKCYCFGRKGRASQYWFATSDATGAFRLNLPPGNYRVGVAGPNRPGLRQAGYVEFYYPGTSDQGRASPVAVTAGQASTNILLRLPPATSTFVIRGTVIHPPAPTPAVPRQYPPPPVRTTPPITKGDRPVFPSSPAYRPSPPTHLGEPAHLTLMTEDGHALAVTDENGAFEFHAVPPGSYTIIALSKVPIPPPQLRMLDALYLPWMISGQAVVTVGESDVSGIVVELRRGAEVSGRIISTEMPPPGRPFLLTHIRPAVFLRRRDDLSLPVELFGEILSTGAFRVGSVPPGQYALEVSRPTYGYAAGSSLENWLTGHYVQSVTVAGQPNVPQTIDVASSGVSGLEVTMGIPPRLSVQVRDAGGSPVAQGLVTVTPTTEDPRCLPKSASSDQNGLAAFTLGHANTTFRHGSIRSSVVRHRAGHLTVVKSGPASIPSSASTFGPAPRL